MSPRNLRRRNLMDHSITSTSKRHKARSLVTSEKKSLPYNDKDLENQEDRTNAFFLNDSQKKHARTRSMQSLKKKMYLEKSKKRRSSKKSTLIPNLDLKVNDNVHDNSMIDIDNISCELLEKQSPIQFINTPMHCSKRKQYKISPMQSSINLDKNSKEEKVHNNSLNGTITPKCSPISVTLTPLRTTKTPKRSPVNLASPKIHSEVPFRLSKTPRKLQLFNNSTTISSSLDISPQKRRSIHNDTENTTLGNISGNDVNKKSNKLRKSRTSTEKLKLMLRRSSRSPKIVLRLPSSKSEIRASKTKLDNRKDRNISVNKLRFLKKNVSRKTSPFSNKNNSTDKSLSGEESQLELTLTNIGDLAEKYKEIILKKPIVLLERIPLLDSLSVSLKTQSNRRLMDTTLDVAKHVQKQLFKDLSSLKHSISHIDQKDPIKTDRSILSESFNNKKHAELNNTNIISSTPISTRNSNSSFTPMSFTDERAKQNGLVETDVKNSTYNMNLTNDNQNGTMVIENEETPVTDETYDLYEPRTPHLRQQCRKSVTLENDNKKEIKKNCKVRFTTPERQIEKLQSNNNIAIRKTPCVKYISRKRSNSLSNTSTNKSTPNIEFKRRSISISNISMSPCKNNNKKEKTRSSMSGQIKSNTENEEKKDIKTHSVKKKIPNFLEIHKQMFAKMESIVDNKKRVMEQHEALKTPKVSKLDKNSVKKYRTSETKNQKYNRFGFKIKKADATNIILKKQQTNVQKKKREENKAILKGVRTNRRFELLMKMRKISD